jgi:hypothetical protein
METIAIQFAMADRHARGISMIMTGTTRLMISIAVRHVRA